MSKPELIQALLKNKLSLDAKDKEGCTPKMLADHLGPKAIARTLGASK